MEDLLITVEDVKNELGINLVVELDKQPKYVDKWLKRNVQTTIFNHIARYRRCGIEAVARMISYPPYAKTIKDAMIEQVDYLASNNYVQANKVMNTGGQVAAPIIAPLAHQLLLNAGLLYTGIR